MAYSSWDDILYKSGSGGYKVKASAARNGMTIESATKQFGALPQQYNGQVSGYNPAAVSQNLDLGKANQTLSSGGKVGGITYDNPGAMAPKTAATTTAAPSTASGAMSPRQTSLVAPAATGRTLMGDPKPPTFTMTPVSTTPSSPAAKAAADMKLQRDGLLADLRRYQGLMQQYKGTESEQPYYDASMKLSKQIEALNGAIATQERLASQPATGLAAGGSFGAPAAQVGQVTNPTLTTPPRTPVQMAQGPQPTAGQASPGADQTSWKLTVGSGNVPIPASQPSVPAAQGGGGLSVPTPVGPIMGGKVISEGGANQASGAQIPAAGAGVGTNGGNPAGGIGLPGGTSGGPAPVVSPPYTGGTPAAGAPSPSQQGAGLAGLGLPSAPTWTQATTAGGGAAPSTTAGPTFAPWSDAPAIRDPYTGMTSALSTEVSPFDDAYQKRLAGQAVDNAEEQYKLMADRIRGNVASRGLMSGGASGIEAGMLNDLAMQTASARTRGMNDAMLKTADQRAQYGLQRAQGLDSFANNRANGMMSVDKAQYDRYRDLKMAPAELERTKAQVAGQLLQNDQDRQNLELIRQNWDLIRQKEQAGLELTLVEIETKKWLAENSGWLGLLGMGLNALPGGVALAGLMSPKGA